MWGDLFSWAVVGILVPILIGVGVGAMSMTPPEYWVARVCFTIACILLFAKIGIWLIISESPLAQRIIVVFVLFGIIGVGWVEALRWVGNKQTSLEKKPPKVIVRLYASPEKWFYKYPLQEYFLSIDIQNPDYIAITDFRMEINFKNIVEEVKSAPLLETGATSVGWIRIYSKKPNEPEFRYEEQPTDTSITKDFSISIVKAKINDNIVNTNFVSFQCAKWPEKVNFSASIIVDLSKEPKIRKKPDKVGTYEGQYFYEINGRTLAQTLNGPISSGPISRTGNNTKLFEQMFSDIDPQKGSLLIDFINKTWLEQNNRFVEIVPYVKRGVFEFHAYRDVDNIFKVLISNTFSKNVILQYGDLDKLKSNPRHPKHIMIVTWGDGGNKLYLDGLLVDEYPKK
ncbi:MAG: hypothetical protein WAK96_00490 [Desulfobaccales bacterium]